jgi:nucleotide-binding universal stress UspA family protein
VTHIIVGIDGSDHSINAYRWAIDEAHRRDAEVTALFAWELPMVGIPGAFEREEMEGIALQFLNDQLDGIEHENGVRINLLEACKRTDAEMLVLGSRGRGGFSGLLLGSVGQECASHAPCPVLICKAHGDVPE